MLSRYPKPWHSELIFFQQVSPDYPLLCLVAGRPFIPKKAPGDKSEKPGGLRLKKAPKAKAKGAAKAKAAPKGGAPGTPVTNKRPRK